MSLVSQDITEAMNRASWIRKMFEKGAELKQRLGPENVFDLSLGNPVIEPPSVFFETLKKVADQQSSGLHRYMSNAGFEDVRQTIADDLSARKLLPTTADNINMCVGAGGGLNVLLKALLNPNDEVVILSPFFVEYMFYIRNHGGVPVTVSTDEHFDLDLEAIAQALNAKTRALILCSPNNPTGTIYSAEKISQLHKLLNDHKNKTGRSVFIISDEPYREIYYGDTPLPPTVHDYPDSAIVYSWSKSLSIPGDRIGYIALHKDNEDPSLKNAITFCTRILGFVNAPATMQLVVKELIKCDPPVEHYRKLRNKLIDGLSQAGYTCETPMGAFYAFPKIPDKYEDDVTFVNAAQEECVLVVPGSGFGWPGNFRISYAVEERVVDGAIEKLAALV